MKNYFRGGVPLSELIYQQPRVKSAMQRNNSNIEKTLTFFPTFTITRRLFQLLDSYSDQLLLCGNFGVGKTISLILYTELTKHIWNHKKMCSIDEKPSKEFGDLI